MNKASVIWLNYNSMRFINLALSSLKSVFDLDYKDFEVIIVDNASTDGSFEAIKRFIDKLRPKQRVRIIQSDRKRGYSGGMNLGFVSVDLDK
ncbi:MAG: glycosyltransferase [Vulcanisaeta sp.]